VANLTSWRGELLKRVTGKLQQWVVLQWRSTWKVKQLKPGRRICLDALMPCRGDAMNAMTLIPKSMTFSPPPGIA